MIVDTHFCPLRCLINTLNKNGHDVALLTMVEKRMAGKKVNIITTVSDLCFLKEKSSLIIIMLKPDGKVLFLK